MSTLELPFYEARGNTYFVATPAQIRALTDFPAEALDAAKLSMRWAPDIAEKVRKDPRNANGLLVGPFPLPNERLGLLILNTDGSLSEFSGNGVTIFSQFLVEGRIRDRSHPFGLCVFHDRSDPIEVVVEPAERERMIGFWVDMGKPRFGPDVVEATPHEIDASEMNGHEVSRVFALENINTKWTRSQFVKVGNPHCVTFVSSAAALPLESRDLTNLLTGVAYSSVSGEARGGGRPCKHGVNLQWAVAIARDTLEARVFERGEGWTKSSGSSATAVASAARRLGLVSAETISVKMPGGTAPIRFTNNDRAMLFGHAYRTRLG